MSSTRLLAKLRTADIGPVRCRALLSMPVVTGWRRELSVAAVQSKLGFRLSRAMSEENPGVDLYRDKLYIVDSGTSIAKLRDVIGKMAELGKELGRQFDDRTAGRRRLSAARLDAGSICRANRRAPAGGHGLGKNGGKAVAIGDAGDLLCARTDAGGGKRFIESQSDVDYRWWAGAQRKSRTGLKAQPRLAGDLTDRENDDLRGEDYEISHGGYDPQFVQEDPDRLVPLDAMREMEGSVSSASCTMNLSPPAAGPTRFPIRGAWAGRWLNEVKQAGVDAVILTST